MEENSMNHIHLINDNVIGSYEWKGKLDLLNIVMIGLAEELPGHDEKYELHRLLGAFFCLVLISEITILRYTVRFERTSRKNHIKVQNVNFQI